MEAMKTRTVQDVPRPPFSDWWCYIHNITPTSALIVKLEGMAMLRALGAEIPAFIKTNVIDVPKRGDILSVNAIKNSPAVSKIVWHDDKPGELGVTINFKDGDFVHLSEKYEDLETDTKWSPRRVDISEGMEHEIFRVRLLRRLFRIHGFIEKI